MLTIPKVNDVDIAFGGCKNVLPAWKDIPEEFQRDRSPFCDIVSQLFFNGGKLSDYGLTGKDGVDVSAAMRAIKCCMGSFSSKHEHKIAGVAFMFSEWFDLNKQDSKAA